MAYIAGHPDEAGDITVRAYNNPDAASFRTHMRELLHEDYWSDWRFDCGGMNHMVEGFRMLCVKGGFDPAWLYQLTYDARDPKVLGIGLAAMRDMAAHARMIMTGGRPTSTK